MSIRTLVCICLLAAAPAHAIVIRHDREDADYRALGGQFTGVVRLGGGTATLIGDRWLLTAAHVADGLSPFAVATVDGRVYPPAKIYCHPTWKGEGDIDSIDMAIVELRQTVEGVAPQPLYEWDDESKKTVTFVGGGMTGDGKRGPVEDDMVLRGATNVCEEVLGDWVRYRFDAPESATELEGISGPGDSGGPAFIERNGVAYVAAVSSSNDRGEGTGPCTYGTDEYYARVSSSLKWIRRVMAGDVAPTAVQDQETHPYDVSRLPETSSAAAAATFFAAFVDAGFDDAEFDAGIRKFESQHRSEGALEQKGVEDRLGVWQGFRDRWKALTPKRYFLSEDGEISVLAQDKNDGRIVFTFKMDAAHPEKVRGVMIAM